MAHPAVNETAREDSGETHSTAETLTKVGDEKKPNEAETEPKNVAVEG